MQTILIIEDESVICADLECLFSAAGYEVLCAANAREAREILAEFSNTIDLITCDNTMEPGDSGAELLKEVTQNYPHIKRIMISAKGPDDIQKISDAHFIKPFHPEAVLAKVRSLLTPEVV